MAPGTRKELYQSVPSATLSGVDNPKGADGPAPIELGSAPPDGRPGAPSAPTPSCCASRLARRGLAAPDDGLTVLAAVPPVLRTTTRRTAVAFALGLSKPPP